LAQAALAHGCVHFTPPQIPAARLHFIFRGVALPILTAINATYDNESSVFPNYYLSLGAEANKKASFVKHGAVYDVTELQQGLEHPRAGR